MSVIDRFISGFRTTDRGASEPPGLVQEDDGSVVYIKPDGSRVEVGGGGGGSLPVPSTQDFNGGPTTTVANGANANLPWATGEEGPDFLVDRSNPTEPLVLVGGIYAVTVAITAVTDMSVGGFFEYSVQLDADGLDLSGSHESRLATAAQPQPHSLETVVGYIPTNGGILVHMNNRDGSDSVDFAIGSAWIQRLT